MSPALIALIIILSFTLFAAVFFFFLGPYLIRKVHEAIEKQEIEERQEILNRFTTMTYGDESPEEVERMYKEVYHDHN